MAQKTEYGTRQKNSLYFKSNDLDYQFQAFVLGYATYGGATVGEALYTAKHVNEKDLKSWWQVWNNTAVHTEAQANLSLQAGHVVSARKAFLRAFTYYRTSAIMLSYHDPLFKETFDKARACYREFAHLSNPAIEVVQIPFEGKFLRGYFAKPQQGNNSKLPTYITIGGGDTLAEDLYFFGGAAALERGYNVLMVDLPGQGTTPFDGLTMRHDSETAVRTMVDYLVSRSDVATDKIVASGVSLGGYFTLRAASYEKRLRTIALSTPIVDWHQALLEAAPAPFRMAPNLLGAITKFAGLFSPSQVIVFDRYFHWQTGAATMGEAFEKFKSWRVDVSQVTCPTLCIVGDGEDEVFKKQTRLCYDSLKTPKRLVICTEKDGADAHCQTNNLQYGQQLMFDWFDDVLNGMVI
jgi:pimeloyl-ACP methyl ester carboxylesterase